MNTVEQNISTIQLLCKNHEVDKLYLFGSILGTTFSEKSDIDFVVNLRILNC